MMHLCAYPNKLASLLRQPSDHGTPRISPSCDPSKSFAMIDMNSSPGTVSARAAANRG